MKGGGHAHTTQASIVPYRARNAALADCFEQEARAEQSRHLRAGDSPARRAGEGPMSTSRPRAATSAAEPAPRPPAALYIRVSSEKQAGNYSPETQERDCRAYAAAKGY